MNISDVIKSLSQLTIIDFSDQKERFSLFAAKYDKNNNSIFEKQELEALKQDLLLFANEDGKIGELNKQEEQNNSSSQSVGDVNKNHMSQDIQDLAVDLINVGKRKIIDMLCADRNFNVDEKDSLCNLSIDKIKHIKDMIYIEDREEQFSAQEIANLALLSDERFECAKSLFYVKNRTEQFKSYDIYYIAANLSKNEFERVKELSYIKNRDQQLNCSDITILAKLHDEEFKRAKALLNSKNDRLQQFEGYSICDLAYLSDEQMERAKTLFHVDNREVQFSGYDIAELAQLSDEQLERAKTLFHVDNREVQFCGYDIAELAQLSDEQLERAKTLFHIDNREEQFRGSDIAELAQLPDEQLERAKTLFHIDNREEQFRGSDITKLAQLSDKEFERAKTLFHINNRKYDLVASEIIPLVKLSDEEFERAKSLLYIEGRDEQLSSTDVECIAKNYCKELEYILTSNPNFETDDDKYGVRVGINENEYYLCRKDKGLELITERNTPAKQVTLINKDLKIKEEIVYDDKEKNNIFSETLTYYDDNNTVTKILTIKRNTKSGTLNVSETDRNGNTIPIQWESTDSETETKITERHLTSPNGDKTNYYCEEDENLKVTDYEITDKNGKALISIHQTLEKISEDMYVSSINATGNHKDTQIYQIKYTTDNEIQVFDKKNNKTIVINLNEYFSDNESKEKLLPILKQLPGHVLLKLKEKPIVIKYDKDRLQNGGWQADNKHLYIGNYEDTDNLENNNLLHTMLHEFGHYLDLYQGYDTPILAQNEELLKIYKEELENLQHTATTQQQEYIAYFTFSEYSASRERIAETHSLMYTTDSSNRSTRQLYFSQYFPKTIAKIMDLLLKKEGVACSSNIR